MSFEILHFLLYAQLDDDDVNCCSILPSSHSYNRIGYDQVVPVVVIHTFISSLGRNVIPIFTHVVQTCMCYKHLYVLNRMTLH